MSGKEYRIDLLFYHVKLRCYVVFDLKGGAFKPEYTGKMNFYLSAVDDLLRHPEDKPGIGLILCKEKDGIVAEYALRAARRCRVHPPGELARPIQRLPPDDRRDRGRTGKAGGSRNLNPGGSSLS